MFIVTTYLRALPGQESALKEALKKLVQQTREESGNTSSVLHQSLENERAFFLYEIFHDQDAFEEHSVSVHFRETMEAIDSWLAQAPGIAVYRQVS
jgi:quinol monooxygenase YgiN